MEIVTNRQMRLIDVKGVPNWDVIFDPKTPEVRILMSGGPDGRAVVLVPEEQAEAFLERLSDH